MNEAVDRLIAERQRLDRGLPATALASLAATSSWSASPSASPAAAAGAAAAGQAGLRRRRCRAAAAARPPRPAGRGPAPQPAPAEKRAAAAAEGPQAADRGAEARARSRCRTPVARQERPLRRHRCRAPGAARLRGRDRRPGGAPGERARLGDPGPRVRPARPRRPRRHRLRRRLVPRRRAAEDLDALEPADQVRLHPADRRDVHHPAGRHRHRRARHPAERRLAARHGRAARGPQRGALRPAPEGVWSESPNDPATSGRLHSRAVSELARRLRRERSVCAWPPPSLARCVASPRLPRGCPSGAAPARAGAVEQIVIGGTTPALRGPRLRAAPAGRGEPGRLPHDQPGPAQRPALRGPLRVRPGEPARRHPPAQPRRAELRGLEGHRREDPRRHAGRGRRRRAHRRGAGLLRRLRRRPCSPAATRARPTTRASSPTRPPTTS